MMSAFNERGRIRRERDLAEMRQRNARSNNKRGHGRIVAKRELDIPPCPSIEAQNAMMRAVLTWSPDELIEQCRDKSFRETLNHVFIYWMLRHQIRALRLQRGWTQEELGRRAGIPQENISKLERVYAPTNLRVSTLRKLAEAFDVSLKIRFDNWGSLLKDIEDAKGGNFEITSFADDPTFQVTSEQKG